MAANVRPSIVQILAMPDGYDTVAGERGVMLSGEEVTELALADAVTIHPARIPGICTSPMLVHTHMA